MGTSWCCSPTRPRSAARKSISIRKISIWSDKLAAWLCVWIRAGDAERVRHQFEQCLEIGCIHLLFYPSQPNWRQIAVGRQIQPSRQDRPFSLIQPSQIEVEVRLLLLQIEA